MTEEQKRAAIASLFERAKAADRRGLFNTGKLWREYALHIATMSAGDLVQPPNLASDDQ
jgi:hypothetical protein